jgi:WD40 repeat protein
VKIFHGHRKTINSTLFLGNDRFVSSSDDGFVHIWDSRSTSCSSLLSIECVSPCNRLSLSNDILAVPLDNRDIRLYSTINGEKLHVQRRAHGQAVQCSALLQCNNSMEVFLASGSLDQQMHVWNIKNLKRTNNMKSTDRSSSENAEGQHKKMTKRITVDEKSTNSMLTIDKKPLSISSNATSNKQTKRTLSLTTK